jgi:chromosome segregation ATPase
MIKEIERQVRDLQKALSGVQKEWNLLRLQPCRGDGDIRRKDEKLNSLEERLDAIQDQIRELERQRRDALSGTGKKEKHESPSV